jgi:DNA topoisomerase I
MSQLIIVESPAKAKKIQSFLKDRDVTVRSSFGHINNLDTTKLNDMIKNNFTPIYKTTNPKAIKILKSVKATDVILAADDDREGDAIAWHCGNLFKLDYSRNNRIKFNEISKRAITRALDNPERLDLNSVKAQQCRQFIDLMIGFKISPLLWRHVKTDKRGLSAGRVQSCLLNILQEHENKIKNHKPTYTYDLKSDVKSQDVGFESEFNFTDKSVNDENILKIMNNIKQMRECRISKKEKSEERDYSPPPFITSSLQQSAQQQLGFNVKMTMKTAQKLYENGKITYHRTDSTFMSYGFKKGLRDKIIEKFGESYYLDRKMKKTKGSQEAHECIRVVYLDKPLEERFSETDKKLYKLIFDRTVISHMQPALFDVLTLYFTNELLKDFGYYTAKIKSLKFDGYYRYIKRKIDKIDLKIYENIDKVSLRDTICKYLESNPPQYFNESTTVKKLESSGIGRPSTYASLIETLYNREYTETKDIDAESKTIPKIELKGEDIKKSTEIIKTSKQKKRIVVTDLGRLVLKYLSSQFEKLLNIEFTANVERDLDFVSRGEIEWISVVRKLYDSIHSIIEREMKTKMIKKGASSLGKIDGIDIIIKNGKYGNYFNFQDKNYSVTNYLKFKKISVDRLTIQDCAEIIRYPRKIGSLKKKPVTVNMGPYGYYVKYDGRNIKIDQNPNKWSKEYILQRLK